MRRALFWLLLVFTLAACADPNTNAPPLITQFDADSDALEVTFRWQLIEPDGDALTCQLDIDGDGVFEYTIRDCATNTSQAHRYLAPGQYDVILVVDDGKGESSVRQQSLSLSALMPGNTPPDIDDFRAIPASGDSPLATTFTWLVFDADGDALSCILDPADGSQPYAFDDCNITTSQPHVYRDVGAFDARLVVDDGGGGITQRDVRSQVLGGRRVSVQGNVRMRLVDALPTWTSRLPSSLADTNPLIAALQPQPLPASRLLARDRQGRILADAPLRADGNFRMQLTSADPIALQIAFVTDTSTVEPNNTSGNTNGDINNNIGDNTGNNDGIDEIEASTDNLTNSFVCTWHLADADGDRWLEPNDLFDVSLGTFQLANSAFLRSRSDTATRVLLANEPAPSPTTLRVFANDPCPSYDVRGQLSIEAEVLPPDGFANVVYALADTAAGWLVVAAAPVDTPTDAFTLTVPAGVTVRLLLTRAGDSPHNFLPLWPLTDALTVNDDISLGMLALTLQQRQGQQQQGQMQTEGSDTFIVSDREGWFGMTLARSEAGMWQTWLPEGALPGRSSAYSLTDNLASETPLATWQETLSADASNPRIIQAETANANPSSNTPTASSATVSSATASSATASSATASSRSTLRNRPVVDIQLPERSKRGTAIDLDASRSADPDGLPLSYIWRWLKRPTGSRSRLSDDHSEQVRFTPDIAGEYVLELLVSNGERVTIDTVTLDVQDNQPPTVSLEAETEVSLGDGLELRALVTDDDDDSVGVRWQLEQAPATSRLEVPEGMRRLNMPADAQALTLTPDTAGDYVVSVVVTDGDVETRSSKRISVFDDFVVTHPGDSGRGSLRWALGVANATPDTDTITIRALSEAIVLSRPLPALRDDLTIRVEGDVTLQAGGTDMRLFEVNAGVSLTMTGMTLTGGRAGANVQQGGALYVHEGARASLTDCRFVDNGAQAEGGAVANFGQLELFNCTFEGNLATRGGAIYAAAGSHNQLVDSAFIGNSAARAGGAVYQAGTLESTSVRWQANATSGTGGALWSSGILELTRNHFDDNRAGTGGGGIWQQSGRINLENSQLQTNVTSSGRGGGLHLGGGARAVLHANQWLGNRSASDNGGALFISEGSHAEVSESTFYNNRAHQFAGAIDNFGRLQLRSSTLRENYADKAAALSNGTGARAEVDSCLFVANRAVQFAGAIANFAALELINTTLSGNQAAFGGAILSGNNATHTDIAHSTIVANRAPQGGAGILHGQGDTTLAHSIVLGNLSQALTGDCVHTDDSRSQVTSLGHNLLGYGGGCTAVVNDMTLPARALFEEVLSPLTDNGGSTHSHALLTRSPALDAGAQAENHPPFDQRGEGFLRLSGQALDIGAFEAGSQTAERP